MRSGHAMGCKVGRDCFTPRFGVEGAAIARWDKDQGSYEPIGKIDVRWTTHSGGVAEATVGMPPQKYPLLTSLKPDEDAPLSGM